MMKKFSVFSLLFFVCFLKLQSIQFDPEKDYYKILGVSETASQEEIKKAYKKLALQWHPDKHSHESKEKQDEATERFKEISNANDILSDPETRKEYNLFRKFTQETEEKTVHKMNTDINTIQKYFNNLTSKHTKIDLKDKNKVNELENEYQRLWEDITEFVKTIDTKNPALKILVNWISEISTIITGLQLLLKNKSLTTDTKVMNLIRNTQNQLQKISDDYQQFTDLSGNPMPVFLLSQNLRDYLLSKIYDLAKQKFDKWQVFSTRKLIESAQQIINTWSKNFDFDKKYIEKFHTLYQENVTVMNKVHKEDFTYNLLNAYEKLFDILLQQHKKINPQNPEEVRKLQEQYNDLLQKMIIPETERRFYPLHFLKERVEQLQPINPKSYKKVSSRYENYKLRGQKTNPILGILKKSDTTKAWKKLYNTLTGQSDNYYFNRYLFFLDPTLRNAVLNFITQATEENLQAKEFGKAKKQVEFGITLINDTWGKNFPVKEIYKQKLENLEKQVPEGTKTEITKGERERAFFQAALTGDLEKLKENKIDNINKIFIYKKNGKRQKEPALIIALAKGHLNIVKYLAKEGADLALKDGVGRTAASLAALDGNTEIIKYFIEEKNMNPDIRDDDNTTPLMHASLNAHLETVKYLLQKGANPTIANKNGETATDLTTDQNIKDLLKIAKKSVEPPKQPEKRPEKKLIPLTIEDVIAQFEKKVTLLNLLLEKHKTINLENIQFVNELYNEYETLRNDIAALEIPLIPSSLLNSIGYLVNIIMRLQSILIQHPILPETNILIEIVRTELETLGKLEKKPGTDILKLTQEMFSKRNYTFFLDENLRNEALDIIHQFAIKALQNNQLDRAQQWVTYGLFLTKKWGGNFQYDENYTKQLNDLKKQISTQKAKKSPDKNIEEPSTITKPTKNLLVNMLEVLTKKLHALTNTLNR